MLGIVVLIFSIFALATLALAAPNRSSENIGVLPIVVPELKFGDVQRHVFFADFVERADNTAFEDRPETLNRIGVNRTDNVLAHRMIDGSVRISGVEFSIPRALIGTEQANFIRDGFLHEIEQCISVYFLDYASDYVALAANRASNRSFARSLTASPIMTAGSATGRGIVATAPLIPMLILEFPADESFVHFDNTAKFLRILDQGNADAVRHIPSGFERTKSHVAPELTGAHSLFAGEHKVDDADTSPGAAYSYSRRSFRR